MDLEFLKNRYEFPGQEYISHSNCSESKLSLERDVISNKLIKSNKLVEIHSTDQEAHIFTKRLSKRLK